MMSFDSAFKGVTAGVVSAGGKRDGIRFVDSRSRVPTPSLSQDGESQRLESLQRTDEPASSLLNPHEFQEAGEDFWKFIDAHHR